MNGNERLQRVRDALLLRERLLLEGVSERNIRDSVATGAWAKVASGAFVPTPIWKQWYPEDRHLALLVALDARTRTSKPVFSRTSAAAIHGLPCYGADPLRAHATVPSAEHANSRKQLTRHVAPLEAEDIVEIGGLLCTSLDRTLLDIARFSVAEQAICALDAGLRMKFGRKVRELQIEWRAEQLARLNELGGYRGVRAAQRHISFADGRADSVAESLSRLQLRRLGYPVAIQVEVPAPKGTYRIDFEFLGLKIYGEVDGESKYLDPRMLGGKSSAESVLYEKHREDWVRGTKDARMVRWGFPASRSSLALGRRLREFNVPPPPFRP